MIQAPQNRVTQRVKFSAAHHIPDHPVYANNHGHNWEALISVDLIQGEPDKSGYVVTPYSLRSAASQFDNDDLNKHLAIPTAENVAQKIANDALDICIVHNGQNIYIVNVELWETADSSASASASNFAVRFNEDPMMTPLTDQLKDAHDAESAYAFGGNAEVTPIKSAKFIKRTR